MLGIPLWLGFRTGFGIYSFITLFVMATIGPFLYRFLQKKVDDLLLSDQRKYQDFLYWSANRIVKIHELDKLYETIVKIIAEAVKIEYAVLFLKDKDKSAYVFKTNWNGILKENSFPDFKELAIPENEPVIDIIKKNEKPFFNENSINMLKLSPDKPAQLIIPLSFDNKLLGFIILGEKLNRSYYTREDNKAFETFSNQAALAIENCQFIEENKKIQERLFAAEKFSLLGGMAEGLAHQIRNRINHFSLASSGIQMEIEKFSSEYKYVLSKFHSMKRLLDDISEINSGIIKNVQRTNDVVNNFIEYALLGRDDNQFSHFPLKKAIDIAFRLVQIKQYDIRDIFLETEIDNNIAIYGIRNQIEEMLYNLLDNSFEAIEEKSKLLQSNERKNKYEPLIKIRLNEIGNAFIIEAFDNGIGIKEENRAKIFAPYFTTKSSFKTKPNQGIGMYIMNRIVEDVHKGKIRFESEYMKGTTFYITLPKNFPKPSANGIPAA